MPSQFNIRVYGIYFYNNQVLVSDEFRGNTLMTKFPGGGLEFGESTIDCLERECIEEFGQEFIVIKHLYTTDFFITSAFNHKQQLISIYYQIKPKNSVQFKVSSLLFDFEKVEGAQSFRWINIEEIEESCFTFDIDKAVAKKIKELTFMFES